MKTSISLFIVGALSATVLLVSCGKSDKGQPAMPETQKALGTAADETKKVVSDAASTAVEAAKTTASDFTSKFVNMAKAQGDNLLGAIGQDLGLKAKSLVDSCGSNESVKTNVEASLTSLQAGKDNEALAPAFQLSQGIGLTDSQRDLAKQVGNLASAFVVQRNFSSLESSKGDVANLVNSLRGGQYAAALPPLKNLMSEASLTPSQKQILSSVADKYAPSLKQAAGALQQGLQGLGGLGGTKK